MKTNIKEDLSILTTINKLSIDRIFDKVNWCICDNLERTIDNKETLSEFDLGFGTLYISLLDGEVKYKFIPSEELEKAIIETVVEEKNPLTLKIEENLVSRITNVYKDLF